MVVTTKTENSAPSDTEGAPITETPKRSNQPDNIPGSPDYNLEKYGYSLITEKTFEGGYHEGDYQKDGVMYCGYCHTPKQVLHGFSAPG